MTQVVTASGRERFSVRGLRKDARPLHQRSITLVNVGWVCVVPALLLSMIGISNIGLTEPGLAMRQIVFLGIGVCAAGLIAVPHFRWAQRLSYPFMLVVLALLVFVLIPFVPEILVRPRNGARRWINIFITDLQPSELAKIAYVLVLASYLRLRPSYRTLLGLLLPLALTFLPLGLILIEPDLGTAMLFLPTFFAMVIAAGAKLWHIALIIILGVASVPVLYPALQPHQKARIEAMFAQMRGDDRHADDIGYQGDRAVMLVGSGGITGVGAEHARDLIVHNHLPEEHNDMIFAVITCRWGLLGALITWGLFLMLCCGSLLVAGLSKDPFGRLVAVGFPALVFSQVAINTGMTIGVLPITGMTLPFVSYGGSSLVVSWLMIGLLLNIAMRRPQHFWRESFEFDGAEQNVS